MNTPPLQLHKPDEMVLVFSASYYRRCCCCCCCCCSSNNNNDNNSFRFITPTSKPKNTLLTTPAHRLPKPSHTEMSRRHSETAKKKRGNERARARLKTRGRRPTKEQTEEPKSSSYILRVLSQGGPAGAFRPGYHSGCPLQLGIPYRPVLYF